MLAPDIAFIAANHLPAPHATDWKVFPRLSPDLVVEIASPSKHRPEMAVKANLWLSAGVPLVWIIWPSRREVDVWHAGPAVEMKTLESSDVLDGETVLPGFTFPIARL